VGRADGVFKHAQQLIAMGYEEIKITFELAQQQQRRAGVELGDVDPRDGGTVTLQANDRLVNRLFRLVKQLQNLDSHEPKIIEVQAVSNSDCY
jgi:hypothetical protein